ncbi:nitroreductase family protein [Streptomyces sp. SID9124]|uniref:nitroreductase family protein n=1 Tax=Streptomyces sp. SID9124 TaxID=2706108 RepID=UPI0013E0849F|nr:nitroreductase family protein [Streptomyces sp. SID9124]NED13059.1 hypothetical protein [Streptomyces sp. SID9124]
MPLIPLHEPADAVADMVRRRVPLPSGTDPAPDGTRPVLPPGRPLQEVLAGRVSVRRFTDEPVARAELAAVLARARVAQRDQWPSAVHGDPGLRLLVAARHVSGLAAGLYDWPAADEPRPLGHRPPPETLTETYTRAPALVLVCGSVTRAAGAAAGGLLVRAGGLGYAVWLAARTHGLECSAYGAAWAPARRALATTAGTTRHLFTVAIGHPAPR